MKKLRLGLIGAGIAAQQLHGPAIKALSDRFEVAAISNRNPETGRALAQWYGIDVPHYTDYRALLGSGTVDAVTAAVPVALNLEIARACVESGVHALIEKPVACNMGEAWEMIGLAERGAISLFIAENFRYSPELLLARRMVEAGEIGKLSLIRWNGISYTPPENKYAQTAWRQCPVHIGGFISDGGVHVVAGMRLLGGDIAKVQAFGATMQPHLESGDTLLINLVFENGMVGQITLCYGGLDFEAKRPKLYGDRGTIVAEREQLEVWRPDGSRQPVQVTGPSNFQAEFADFYQRIVDGDKSADSVRQAYEDLKVIDAALRSAEAGQVVEVK